MSTYHEKEITFHQVKEIGNDETYFENVSYEVRIDGECIASGYTLEDAIASANYQL